MVRKKINKNSQKSRIISKRHSGVLLEDIDSKMDLMLEGHQVLNGKVESLDKKVDNLDKKVGDLDKKVGDLDKKVGDLDKKVDRNHQEFREFRNEVNYKFEVVFDKLHLIGNELKEKVSRDEFVFLEKRVTALEKSKK